MKLLELVRAREHRVFPGTFENNELGAMRHEATIQGAVAGRRGG